MCNPNSIHENSFVTVIKSAANAIRRKDKFISIFVISRKKGKKGKAPQKGIVRPVKRARETIKCRTFVEAIPRAREIGSGANLHYYTSTW